MWPLQEFTQRILDLFGCHVQDYFRAKELLANQQTSLTANRSSESKELWNAYSAVTAPHLAMTSDAVEVNFVRAVVDLLLHVLVPPPHLETCTGRFVVGELITCNVLLPLIDKLSDPDWLNQLLIDIFDKSRKTQETIATEQLSPSPPLPRPLSESEPRAVQQAPQVLQKNSDVPPQRADIDVITDTEMAMPELAAYDVVDAREVEFPHNTEEDETARPFLRHYIRGSKSNPFYQENDSDLDSPLADYKLSSIDSLVMIGQDEGLFERPKECMTSVANNNGVDLEDVSPSPVDGSCPKVLVNSEPAEHPNDCGSVQTGEGTPSVGSLQDLEREGSTPAVNPNRELLLGIEQTGMMNSNELTVVSPMQGGSPVATFSFEPLSSPEGPVIIQNLRISGTITAKEHRGTGSHPYTLYTIKVRRLTNSISLFLYVLFAVQCYGVNLRWH